MGGTTIGAVASCISQSSVGDAPPCPAFHVGVSACQRVSVYNLPLAPAYVRPTTHRRRWLPFVRPLAIGLGPGRGTRAGAALVGRATGRRVTGALWPDTGLGTSGAAKTQVCC